MTNPNPKLTDKYRNFLIKFFGYEKTMKHYEVDFNQPWWAIIFKEKWRGFSVLFFFSLIFSVIYLQPFILATAIENSNTWLLFAFLVLLRVVLGFFDLYFVNHQNSIFQLNIRESVALAANKFFLTVDPLFHSTRESGKIISKINRGSSAFEGFLDVITFRLLPFLSGILVLTVLLIRSDLWLGLGAVLAIVLMTIYNILAQIFNNKAFVPERVKAGDDLKQSEVETLAQTQFVRSIFASVFQLDLISKKNKRFMVVEGTQWSASGLSFIFLPIFYNTSVLLISLRLLDLIDSGRVSLVEALGLISTYLVATNLVFDAGRMAREMSRSVQEIKDLFDFIREFGKQTYPVLDSSVDEKYLEKSVENPDKISLLVSSLSFKYNSKAEVFNGHSLHLEIPKNQANKVYGIIGQSGKGKTTFMSILGGQLKPDSGKIEVNSIPIYEVSDKVRQNLIAFQMQTATSLRGSLRYNLLFGIPTAKKEAFNLENQIQKENSDTNSDDIITEINSSKNQFYSDEYLIQVLKNVGLWSIFSDKDGLDTLIGEGGLNLSGGQRQRLNFAGLYLRAKFYKPSLILIDEPTSSLDEISEKAITKMILELGEIGLTLVVAHRLKTLEKAVAILDFSTNLESPEMQFKTTKELEKQSQYYRQVLTGEEELG